MPRCRPHLSEPKNHGLIRASLGETATIALTVLPSDYLVGASPHPVTIARGGSTTANITVIPTGDRTVAGAGSVTLSGVNLASGVSATFSPNPTTTGASVMTMKASSTAALGKSSIYIVAYNPNVVSTEVGFQQTVTAAPTPTFAVTTSSPYLTLARGGTVTNTVKVIDLNGFTGSVSLAGNAPPGVAVSFGTNPTAGSSLLKLTASDSAATGVYWLSVSGTSGSQSVFATYVLTVNPSSGFRLSASSASVPVAQGASATDTIAVIPQSGFTGKVTLATPNLPPGLTASFGTNPVSGSSVLTLTANKTLSTGNYIVVLTGTSGTQFESSVALEVVVSVAKKTPSVTATSSSTAITNGSTETLTATAPGSGA
jgi:hypothetical protein